MKLTDKLSSELKHAMIAKDTTRLSVIRAIKTEISKEETSPKMVDKELSDTDVISIIRKVANKHEDSIQMFMQGGRNDLVKKETDELEVVKSFLPEEMSWQDLNTYVCGAIEDLGATTKKDMGKVIKRVTEQVRGRATGKSISEHVAKMLS